MHPKASRCVMLATFSAVIACSGTGTPPSTHEEPGTASPVAPTSTETASPVGPTPTAPDPIVKKICEQQKVDVSVNQCGDFYSTYPTGFIADAATEIFDKNGERIDSCGGNRSFTSDPAREEAERKCSTYLANCKRVAESCRG